MKLFLFTVLIASGKHKTFAEIDGEVEALCLTDAQYFVNVMAQDIVRKTNDRTIFLVGYHVLEADRVKVPSYV